MTFTFRPLRLPDDDDLLVDLLQQGFPELIGTIGGTAEHLRWKFARSLDDGLCLVGFDGDRPVSFYGVVPEIYVIDGHERRIGLVVDVMSHPEVRRRGLFEATGRAAMTMLADTSIEAVEGYPIRDDVMPGHIKVGWEVGFGLPVHVLATGWRGGGGAAPSWLPWLSVGAHAYRLASSVLRRERGAVVRRLDVDDFLADSASARLRAVPAGVSQIDRSDEFLRWRLARPGAEYTCHVVEAGSERGYAITRSLPLRGVPTVAVLDVAVDGRRAARAITAALVDEARRGGLWAIAICANPSFAKSLGLGRLGFVRTPMKFTLIHRSTSVPAASEWFRTERSWRMSWIDSDTT